MVHHGMTEPCHAHKNVCDEHGIKQRARAVILVLFWKKMAQGLVVAEKIRHDHFITIKERPCRVTGIISSSAGMCFSGIDIFHPTRRHKHRWVYGRDTLVEVPIIDLDTIELIVPSDADQITAVTHPLMLSGIRSALCRHIAVTIEMVSWGDKDCMVQKYTTQHGCIELFDVLT